MEDINKLITDNLDIWTQAIQKKSATGRGSNKKHTLYGIKKLRELILDLAVRGKLVPQDPNDEPASELLKRIQAEKEQLIKDKKIKKTKKLPEITEGEIPFAIPKGWAFSRLQYIVSLLGDGLHGTPSYVENGEYYFINGNNLKNGHITISSHTQTVSKVEYIKYKKNLVDSTVLVSINGTLGNVAFFNNELVMLGKSACYFNLLSKISKEYIKVILDSPYFQNYAYSVASGSTIKNLSLKSMNNFIIPLPSLNEQKRIVSKVNELMILCDQLEQQTEDSITAHKTLVETLLNTLTNSKDNDELTQNWNRISDYFDILFTTEESIDLLKQTILQLAVMGKLVPQDPNDEPASELLKRIQAEKEQLIKDKKIKKYKKLPEISEDEIPFNIPDSWVWVKLGEALKKITDGTHHSPINVEHGDYLYISAKNIKESGVLLNNVTYVTKEIHETIYERCDPEYGDILYIKDGATTGIATINDLKEPFSMLSSVALLKCTDEIYNEFLLYILKSPFYFKSMRAGMSGVAITRVTLKKLNESIITLPPLNEQKRIVSKVNDLMNLCNELDRRIKTERKLKVKICNSLTIQGSKYEKNYT